MSGEGMRPATGPDAGAPVLDVGGLWVRSAAGRALACDVDLRVAPGELVALVGESGSGKTLTARCCLGALPAGLRMDARRLALAGTDMLSVAPRARARLLGTQVGYVPQNTVSYLQPAMRVRAQIADGYRRWHPGTTRAQALDRAAGLLEAAGVDDPRRVLASYPDELSGGQRQRVNIAMALMGSPALVVADEPTAALDSLTQVQVADLLTACVRHAGAAMLLISHDLGLVRRRCDRVCVMYAGRVVERGPVDAVLANPGHPYTRALLEAVPRVGDDRSRRLPDVAGAMPEQGRDADACTFAPRCPHACAACLRGLPRMAAAPGRAGHEAACVRAWGRGDAGADGGEVAR